MESCVLDDDRHAGADDRGVGCVARHGLRVVEVVEAQMPRSATLDRHAIGADRVAVGEIDGDLDLRRIVGRVEDASRFVRDEGVLLTQPTTGNVAFGNRPNAMTDREDLRDTEREPRARPIVPARRRVGLISNRWVGGRASVRERCRAARVRLSASTIACQS